MDESGQSAPPRIEVLVGVHSASRPIERVTASALAATAPVGVTVVAHNLDPTEVRARLGALADDPRVRVIGLADGIRSPANAYNAALDAATGEFVSIIGSDDEFARGALDAWLLVADESAADVVVAPVARTSGAAGTAPRPRPGRTRNLDGDRDRLFERAAPLGLVRRERFSQLRLTPGLARGEDQAYTLHLWFSGARVAFDPRLPPYIEHDDQRDRVTIAVRPLKDDLAFFDAVEAEPVFATMRSPARRAFAAKTARVFLVDAIGARLGGSGWDADSREALRAAVRRLERWAPGALGLLARADRAIIDAALDETSSESGLKALLARRGALRSVEALIPARLRLVLHRHAPLRSRLAQRRVARAQAARS
jgi:hypothetical protein